MFNECIENIQSQITEAEVSKAKNITKDLLLVTEGIQFNMIAFDQN